MLRPSRLALASLLVPLASACARAPCPAVVPAAEAPPPAMIAPAPAADAHLASLPSGTDLSYSFELVRDPFPFVEVTVVARGASTGETHLTLHHWADVDHPEREIHRLRVTDDAGTPLPIEHENTWDASGKSPTWTVRHAPDATLHVRYALVSTQYDVGFDGDSYYRPLLQPTFFHAIGRTALLDPDTFAHDRKLSIAVTWRGFKEAGWTVASSFSVEQGGFSAHETLDDFQHAVFLAGELRLVRRDIGPAHSPLWLALAGTEWGFTDDAFADTAAAVVSGQRAFFGDYDWPFFLISVIPVAGDARGKSSTRGGTGLTQSFALFLSPHTSATLDATGTGVPRLLSHELFHAWNGLRYELTDPEALGYWFSEGFTDFYARRLLLRAGLSTPETFVASLNDVLRRYAESPVKAAPASRIAADFWKDHDVEKLPYHRGDLVALVVDAEIRRVSGGTKSLDDLMKSLLATRPATRPKADTERFLGAILALTSPDFAQRIRKIVVDGALVNVDPKLLEPCLQGAVERHSVFDPGVDLTALRERKVILGVAPGSNAYLAGLRDGQKVTRFDLTRDPTIPAVIGVKDGGRELVARYLPASKPIPLVQFHVVGELSGACRASL